MFLISPLSSTFKSQAQHVKLTAILRAAEIPVMGPEASSEYFNIGGWLQSMNTSLFLNIGNDQTSYKTLTFAEATVTDAWALEVLFRIPKYI